MKNELDKQSSVLERELISQLIVKGGAVSASQIIKPEDLKIYHKEFSVLLDCELNKKNISQEFLKNQLFLSPFLSAPISYRAIENICNDIKEISKQRKILDLLTEKISRMPLIPSSQIASEVQSELIKIIEEKETNSSDIKSVITEFESAQKLYEEKRKNGESLIGISSGYDKIDLMIDGIRPEHVWVIGAYTNLGKSFAALNITASLIKQKKRVVIYSLEMSQTDLLSRLIGIFTGYNGTAILKKNVEDEKIGESMEFIKNSNLSIHNGKHEISDITFSMYEENLKNKADLFIVDFIQNVTIKGVNTEYETVTQSALEFQSTARRLKTPILILSQISNEGARSQENDLMMFKGTGAIASVADFAIQIVKGEEDKETWARKISLGEPVRMNWLVKKNRHGRIGMIEMVFDGTTGVFTQFQRSEIDF